MSLPFSTQFSDEVHQRLADIAAGACGITERIDHRVRPVESAGSERSRRTRWSRWQQRIGGDEADFVRRLKRDGIRPETVRRYLGHVAWNEDVPLPDWTHTLAAVFEAAEKRISPDPPGNRTSEHGPRAILSGGDSMHSEPSAPQPSTPQSSTPDSSSSSETDHQEAGDKPSGEDKESTKHRGEEKEQKEQTEKEEPPRFSPVPFEECMAPFLDVASAALNDGSAWNRLQASVRAQFRQQLLKRLSSVGAHTLYSSFIAFRAVGGKRSSSDGRSTYNQFCQRFLAKDIQSFFQRYPVLARQLSTITQRWIHNTRLILHRINRDRADLRSTFSPNARPLGALVEVEGDLSDPHRGGQSVLILTFASGCKIVYKPRSAALAQSYRSLLSWLDARGIPEEFRVPTVIDRGTYSWAEFIEAAPCTSTADVERFYRRTGALLALLYVLNGTDFHSENVIACGDQPVPVDMEMLMTPLVEVHASVVAPQLNGNVMATGLLPTWTKAEDGQRVDMSGLGDAEEKKITVQSWKDINTDNMRLGKWNVTPGQANRNVPHLDGVPQVASRFASDICEAFDEMYQFLQTHRDDLAAPGGPLAQFEPHQARFLMRNTQTYGLMLARLRHPKYLRSGVDWDIECNVLGRSLSARETADPVWKAFQREREELRGLDIPYFRASIGGTSLLVHEREPVPHLFDQSSRQHVQRTLEEMGSKDHRFQRELIQASLYSSRNASAHAAPEAEHRSPDTHERSSGKQSVSPDSPADKTEPTIDEVLPFAQKIEADIRDRGAELQGKGVTWVSLTYDAGSGRHVLQPMNASIHGGASGMALFFSALQQVTTPSEERDRWIREILEPVHIVMESEFFPHRFDQSGMTIGGFSGWGSVAYALTCISDWTGDADLLESAEMAATAITPEHIAQDSRYDVMDGAAGAALGLLKLHAAHPEGDALERAVTCGEHLLRARQEAPTGARVWANSGGRFHTGFSHGAAGIGYALLRLYNATGESRFQSAAYDAFRFLVDTFDADTDNWPRYLMIGNTETGEAMRSWCHGAPGIALALEFAVDHEALPADVRQALRSMLHQHIQRESAALLAEIDHLCCGNLGRIEALTESRDRSSTAASVQQKWLRTIVAAIRDGDLLRTGLPHGFHAGFMRGAPGIGYGLLRAAAPDRLPSILRLE